LNKRGEKRRIIAKAPMKKGMKDMRRRRINAQCLKTQKMKGEEKEEKRR
jgi:hypothetical protein